MDTHYIAAILTLIYPGHENDIDAILGVLPPNKTHMGTHAEFSGATSSRTHCNRVRPTKSGDTLLR